VKPGTNELDGAEEVLLEGWGQQYPSHSIGSLVFGADGALYVTSGDGASFSFDDYGQKGSPPNPLGDPPFAVGVAQTIPTAEGGSLRSQSLRRKPGEPAVLNGAVLRLDPETGAPMADNPLGASTDSAARAIVAYGFRNPYRMTTRPGTSELWVGDVGNGTWEEIDRIPSPVDARARNFGWPCYEGAPKAGGFGALDLCKALYAEAGAVDAPHFAYKHSDKVVAGESCGTGSSSITGLAFYTGSSYPSKYAGALFFADYSRNCAWAMLAGADGTPDPTKIETFAAGMSTPVDLVVGPEGDLYYADLSGGAIRRVRYLTPTARATATPTTGAAPLVVSFDATSSVVAQPGDTLVYAWDLDGDGMFNDGTGPTITYVYNVAGKRTARVRVTDQRGVSDFSDPVTIDVTTLPAGTTPPVPVIDAPSAGATWKVGDAITFRGHATDAEDGALPASALSWLIVMQHCPAGCHAHLIRTWDGVADATFSAPDHEYPSYLELVLVATDSSGARATTSLRLDPSTRWLTLQSVPPGIDIDVGGLLGTTPFARKEIEGGTVSVSAPTSATIAGTTFAFASWADGGGAHRDVGPMSSDTELVASYRPAGLTGEYFDDKNLTTSVLVRTDATVNFDWGAGSPDPSIDADTFSVRWTGFVEPAFSETYTFGTDSDDGIRLTVGGTPVIDNWTDHGPTRNNGTIALTAGQKVPVVLEFYENGGGALAKLWWSSASQPLEIVPAERLWPGCATGNVCSAGLVCRGGACEDACAGVTCAADQLCRAGACADSCQGLACPGGKCAHGRCVDSCTDVTCAAGTKCVDGACVDACQNVACGVGTKCVAGTCVDACQGVTCDPGKACQLGACVDLCQGVMCPVGQKCVSGACVDACQGTSCPGQKCKLGVCVDLCTDVVCGAGTKCVGGACVDPCASVVCGQGQKCAGGDCVDACQGVSCGAGTKCLAGECVDACTGVTCPQGQKCVGGGCVSACTGVSCAAGQICQAGTCVDACSVVTCTTGQICQRGACVDGCSAIECPRGQICTNGACVDLCAGVTCGAGLVCQSGACVDLCIGVTCDEGKVCRVGACVDGCAGITCGAGDKCVGGACVPACQGVTCGAGDKCVGGACVPACQGVTCPLGQRCTAGACVDACDGVACPQGQKCAAGACVDVCASVTCEAGQRCVGGACVDACQTITCPAAQRCQAGACVAVETEIDAGVADAGQTRDDGGAFADDAGTTPVLEQDAGLASNGGDGGGAAPSDAAVDAASDARGVSPEPTPGCSCELGGQPRTTPAISWLLAAVGAFVWRRRRRR
jgi:glucose/arabinose dehydrogenase